MLHALRQRDFKQLQARHPASRRGGIVASWVERDLVLNFAPHTVLAAGLVRRLRPPEPTRPDGVCFQFTHPIDPLQP